jgi:hypothetical protein
MKETVIHRKIHRKQAFSMNEKRPKMNDETTVVYTYEIRPRLGGDGYILTGHVLPHGLWYTNLDDAISHALEVGRAEAGELCVYSINGEVTWRHEWKGDGKLFNFL